MRNKILAILWAFVGMIVGLRVGELPYYWFIRGLSHFVDVGHTPPNMYLVALGIGWAVFSAALGCGWFYRLFYRGELWGYRPDSNSN